MSKDAYRSLIRDFTRVLGLSDHFESILESGGVTLDGVALTVALAPQEDEIVQVYIDFGAIPEDKALDVCRRLLQVNLLLASQGSPRLALDPASDRVIFAYANPLQGITAEKLISGISMAVRQAHAWRKTYFLDDDSDALASASSFDLSHALHV